MEAPTHPLRGASELSPVKSTRVWFDVILRGQSRRHRSWTLNLLPDRRSPDSQLLASHAGWALLRFIQPDLHAGEIYRDTAKAVQAE
jgi:hypothetical protein